MKIYRFKAQALTPIHVGCGHEIDPTEFVMLENGLVRINPAQIISALPQKERERFMGFLERADLKEIQNFLRHHAADVGVANAPVGVCNAFKREFEAKASNPNNQFRVEMMPRNPHSFVCFLPGSGIKGAIRTAVVNHFANRVNTVREGLHRSLAEEPIRQRGLKLEEQALKRKPSETHRDIFRLLSVADVDLPQGSTRIDKAVNIKPQRDQQGQIAMWVERLNSMVDSYSSPEFLVSLGLDTQKMANDRVKTGLGQTIDLKTIMDACNHFFWNRMLAEADRFDERVSNGLSWQAISGVFPKGRLENGEIVSIDPSAPFWCSPEFETKRMIIRVGHFSHFESLSVDELRQGWDIKNKRPIIGMGSTRTRCVMENNKPPMPFGWLMLTLQPD